MPPAELDPAILAFYRDRYDEDQRLTRSRHGQLEFLRTQELLRKYLPPAPATVLDIGGGPGVHAAWLAADGYDVHLIDPVADHVRQAMRRGGFVATQGDARALSIPDGSVDAALLLGPLYHLVARQDRLKALTEARRVVRPGGVILTAAISRYAALLELSGLGLLSEDKVTEMRDLLEDGINQDDPNGFTTGYFHRAEGLALELSDAGLTDIQVLGIEGPTTPALDNAAEERAADVLVSAVRCARLLEADPALLAASPHLLGIGRLTVSARVRR